MKQYEALLTQYQAGEREQVWQALRDMGAAVWEPDVYPTAWAVCELACRRIRRNIETMIDCLTGVGYRFADPNHPAKQSQCPFYPADERSRRYADWLKQQIGPFGMLTSAYICLVGDVDLNGTHQRWQDEFLPIDPLVIEFEGRRYHEDPRARLVEEYADYQDEREDGEPFHLAFAPDALTKANISGGTAFAVLTPFAGIDPMLDLDGESMSLVAYLNQCFSAKCFRFAEKEGEHGFLESLAVDLLLI